MAMKIIASHSEGMKNGKNYIRAEIVVDTAEELSVEGISNYHFTFGSVAWVVSTGAWYGLDSRENWAKQNDNSANAKEGE